MAKQSFSQHLSRVVAKKSEEPDVAADKWTAHTVSRYNSPRYIIELQLDQWLLDLTVFM